MTVKVTEAVIAGLTQGEEYSFRISATNEKGTSDPRPLSVPVVAKDLVITPAFKHLFSTFSVLAGDDLKIDVPYVAQPKAAVTWLKDGIALKETTRVNAEVTEKHLYLVIKEATRDDVGKYTIKITNAVGEAMTDIHVVVLDKPGPPIGPIKIDEVTADSVTLSWQPPEYEGGCTINNYIVEKRDTSTTNWQIVSATVARTTIKAARLKTGCEYQFRIAAENRYGKRIKETYFEIKKLLEKHEYKFRICAINKVGVGENADIKGSVLVEDKLEAPDTDLDADLRKIITVRAGGSLRLFVPIRGRPTPEVKWGKAEGEINETAQIDITSSYTSLVIENVNRFDSGKYTLQLENSSGSKSAFISVRVLDTPDAPTNFHVKEITKNSITLTWEPPLLDGGAKIKNYIVEKRESTRKVYSTVASCNKMTYKIEQLEEGKIYFFRVLAENEYGIGLPAKTPEPLKISEVPQPPGKISVLDVTRKSVSLSWEKPEHDGGSRITHYEVEMQAKESEKWSLCAQVKSLDTTVTNLVQGEDDPRLLAHPVLAKDLVIEPTVRTKLSTYSVQGIVVRAGGSMRINIPFKGRPTPEINWTKDDGDLPSKAQIEKGLDYTQLSIDICDRNDAGKYTLTLENSSGTKTAFVSVKVLDTPGAPQNLVVKDITRNYVTLVWEPPLIDGGAKIKNYIVDQRKSTRPAFSNITTKCNKTTLRVGDLTEGGIYYFRVMAENEFGVGLPIETEDSVKTADPPLPVGKVTLTDVTKTTASLSWEKPDHDGGNRIIGYFIEMQPKGSDDWVVATTTKTCEGTVTGLSTGREYLFRVSAYNDKGKSDPRALATPVTAKDITIEPTLQVTFNTYSVKCGEDLKVEIPVRGRPVPKVAWSKDEQALKETTRLNVSSTATSTILSIKDANREDSGKYTVTATIKIEEISANYVVISWEPPVYTGGCQLNNYVVEKRDTTTTNWQTVSATIARTTIKISKLRTGEEYSFRIVAMNDKGKSDPKPLGAPVVAKDITIEPIIDLLFNTYSVKAGEDLKIDVPFRGRPHPEVTWKKDGHSLKQTTRVNVLTSKSSSKITIKDTIREDAGKYEITLTNSIG
uniref:Titin n=1 Tax=Electrophorus electricus TaxID=8005 RepID=A0AAY5ELP7_ELEEL